MKCHKHYLFNMAVFILVLFELVYQHQKLSLSVLITFAELRHNDLEFLETLFEADDIIFLLECLVAAPAALLPFKATCWHDTEILVLPISRHYGLSCIQIVAIFKLMRVLVL